MPQRMGAMTLMRPFVLSRKLDRVARRQKQGHLSQFPALYKLQQHGWALGASFSPPCMFYGRTFTVLPPLLTTPQTPIASPTTLALSSAWGSLVEYSIRCATTYTLMGYLRHLPSYRIPLSPSTARRPRIPPHPSTMLCPHRKSPLCLTKLNQSQSLPI